MNINVVGAGPAGLYFAARMKQLDPDVNITLYERGDKNASNGLGYTMTSETLQLFKEIDKDCEDNLSKRISRYWDSSTIEAKGELKYITFPESFSITRAELLEYLTSIVEEKNTPIHYNHSLSQEKIKEMRLESDILVGADGINSIVRDCYGTQMGAEKLTGSNHFTWLHEKSKAEFIQTSITQEEGITFITFTYPLAKGNDCVIIERSSQLPEEDLGKIFPINDVSALGNVISTPYDKRNLSHQSVKWYPSTMNTVHTTTFENIVLIGESGVSTHYSIGSGLYLAFSGGHSLAEQIQKRKQLTVGKILKKHNEHILPVLERFQNSAKRSVQWLENIETHYNSLNGKELISSFQERT